MTSIFPAQPLHVEMNDRHKLANLPIVWGLRTALPKQESIPRPSDYSDFPGRPQQTLQEGREQFESEGAQISDETCAGELEAGREARELDGGSGQRGAA